MIRSPIRQRIAVRARARGLRARLVEEGRDYDECAALTERLVREKELHLVHSTNDWRSSRVLGGAPPAEPLRRVALRDSHDFAAF